MTYFERTGRGNANITVDVPLPRGKWKLYAFSNNGDLVAKLVLTNGQTVERRFNRPTSGHAKAAYRNFQVNYDCPSARLEVTAAPSTEWEVSLSPISEESQANTSNQIQENVAITSQTPKYVCVRRTDRLNVRSGPGTKYAHVPGGDRDKGGGAMQGTRYKVLATNSEGERVSGQDGGNSSTKVWHEIEFAEGVTGWITEYYVDAF